MSGPRILIVKTSSMGDVVHALPLVSDLARARPDATIDWVVEEGFAAIPALHPAIDRVIKVALRRWRRTPLGATTWSEVGAARRALRERDYHAVIDCQGLIKSALIAAIARGPVWGPARASVRESLASVFYRHRVALDRSRHAIARSRALGAAVFGYSTDDAPRFSLRLPALTQAELAQFARRGPYAVLLTNASRATKLWPPDRWRAVEAWLAGHGLTSALFWGSDAEARDTHARAEGMRNGWVAPKTPLPQLAALLAGARLVIGLDTGLTHLAAACSAPTLGLFCDYDPALVGVIGDAPCASLGGVDVIPAVAEVIAAGERLLGAARRPA
ncbi:MAG: lipopolysaccharide heptosyltransferase I [Gemmatimonadota bacterium]